MDHIEGAASDAAVEIWVALPHDRPGQKVHITNIEPAPVEIVEERDHGNRILHWRLAGLGHRPDPPGPRRLHGGALVGRAPGGTRTAWSPTTGNSDLYRRFTRSEFLIETDGDVAGLARRIAGRRERIPTARRASSSTGCWRTWSSCRGAPESAAPWARPAAGPATARSTACSSPPSAAPSASRRGTVGVEWLTGGHHVPRRVLAAAPYGWLPADPAAAQVLLPDAPVLSPDEVAAFMETRGLTAKDPAWLFGNLYPNRLEVVVGKQTWTAQLTRTARAGSSPSCGRAVRTPCRRPCTAPA